MLAETYEAELSQLKLAAYWMALEDEKISGDEFAAAARALLAEPGRVFMPRPGEIVEAVRGKTADVVMLALVRVERAMQSAGVYESVDFQDPALNHTIDAVGGWVEVCNWRNLPAREYGFRKAELGRLYGMFLPRREELRAIARAHLPGLHEMHNRRTAGAWTRGSSPTFEVWRIGSNGEIEAKIASPMLPPAEPLLGEDGQQMSPENLADLIQQAMRSVSQAHDSHRREVAGRFVDARPHDEAGMDAISDETAWAVAEAIKARQKKAS